MRKKQHAKDEKSAEPRFNMRKREALTGLAYAAPFLIGFLIFFILPFFITLKFTFTIGMGEHTTFVGFKNYADVLRRPAFWLAAKNTFLFLLTAVPLLCALSLLLAVALHKKFRGANFFRTTLVFPLVLPVASLVMMVNIFFADKGIVPSFFARFGYSDTSWLQTGKAFFILVGIYIFKNCGYIVILFLAGLGTIPSEIYDAADMDGANSRQKLFKVTVPMLAPTFFFVVVISISNAFKSFREAFILGGEIPHKSIYMLQHFMNNNYSNMNYQRLSVAALFVFSLIFVLVYVMLKTTRRGAYTE